MSEDLGNFSMLELFRLEVDNQAAILSDGLLSLEQQDDPSKQLEALMRAAHSIKGAARMVDIDSGVRLAHAMEDCFVAAQNNDLVLKPQQIDLLLEGVDLLVAVSRDEAKAEQVDRLSDSISNISALPSPENEVGADTIPVYAEPANSDNFVSTSPPEEPVSDETSTTDAKPRAVLSATSGDKVADAVRVSAESLNRLVGLAGEVQVEARWLHPFSNALQQVKHRQAELIELLDHLNDSLLTSKSDEYSRTLAGEIHTKANRCRHLLSDRLMELDEFDRRLYGLGNRLHSEVIASRMRPFSDATKGYPRLVRDMARQLGKQVELKIEGLSTQVDRDILESIDAPLNHLIRNALDHGIEAPEQRLAAGKPERATLTVTATHNAGMLSIQVQDDGRGIDTAALREKITRRGMVTETMARELSETELLEFLFLPGFSTREKVTEISGRGVGLDVVHSTIQKMRGVARATTEPGNGTRFHLQLPITLSVVRVLLVEISGEPYAIPLARIDRTMKLDTSRIESLENRQYFTIDNQHVGVVFASQVLGSKVTPTVYDELPVVVLGERLNRSGLVVDRFMGERSLVVHALDPRLGKVQDISAASVLENGDPCLIIDVDDMLRSIDILIAGGRLDRINNGDTTTTTHAGKRILVVDDSITVREVERNMLATRGYHVDVAVDGMDGWNAVRMNDYDLIISDVDMPRMNGFEFVRLIKQDDRLHATPVMIVSYKDREEDRQSGLEAGADYYLAKGSFHDETLIDAVIDLIGTAE
ncbi:two-component system sensor histidine kinase and response regulator WspE [Thiogranum longum]|uniref:Chemotaxis protein CheA n=1 Tax=Thiogranum longum TaxID=1537524 RepID=A0A4R1HDV6_9GAMM|nr:hybrid sensor histidine kinase/response regulator [Thiogranum longum]TCK18901.1 two-component system sensor histidine kinase and response regulator WspE [Thiogranum longum]